MSIFKYIIILLALGLSCADLSAQMQPPLGSCLSWSRKEYESIDSLHQRRKAMNPVVTDSVGHAICKAFRSLWGNYKVYTSYNDSIFFPMSRQKWAEMLGRRADHQCQAFGETQRNIDFILNHFRSGTDLPKGTYDSLFNCAHKLYRSRHDDLFLVDEFVKILLPYYEALGTDHERLALCYIMAGYCDFEISRIDHNEEYSLRSLHYYQRVCNMYEEGLTFRSSVTPFYILCAYCNSMMSFGVRGNITLEQGLEVRQKLQRFYEKNSEQLDRIPNMRRYYTWICNLFDLKAPIVSIQQKDTSSELFDTLYHNYLHCVEAFPKDEFELFMDTHYSDPTIDNWFIQASLGKTDATKAFRDSYKRIMDNLEDVEDADLTRRNRNIQYMYNTIVSSIGILDLSNISPTKKHDYLINYLDLLSEYLSLHAKVTHSSVRSDIERRIMTLPCIRRYLSTEEQIYYLKEFVIYEQPETYAHVTMVSRLCDEILNTVISQRPELLSRVPGCETPDDVHKNDKMVKAFMHDGALFHDLGKNIIPFIVNNSFRKLTDSEFMLIREHPDLSKFLLNINPMLQQYTDLSIGHHRWYNGKGGYPASFDNTSSPYRILIDILTISDCLDAATDNFGRNYHNPKSFKQVLQEFDKEAGTRYNPDIIQLIHDNASLSRKLTDIVETKRMDAYYDIYKRYFRE